jgi:hypothetical protein
MKVAAATLKKEVMKMNKKVRWTAIATTFKILLGSATRDS